MRFLRQLIAIIISALLLGNESAQAFLAPGQPLGTPVVCQRQEEFFTHQALESQMIEMPGLWHSAHNQAPRATVQASLAADLLGPFVIPQRWSPGSQKTWYLAVGLGEEIVFRYLPIGNPRLWFEHGGWEHALIALSVSLVLFVFLHPIARWVARAWKTETLGDPLRYHWHGIRREIARETEQIVFNFSRSHGMAALLFTGPYTALVLLWPSMALPAALAVGFWHFVYDGFLLNSLSQDPIAPRREGQEEQLHHLRGLAAKPIDDPAWGESWSCMGDGDKFGEFNALSKLAIGVLGDPASANLVFYRKSLFRDFREEALWLFEQRHRRLYRGVGGDELEPVLRGSRAEVERDMTAIVADYKNYFKARYGLYEIKGPLTTKKKRRMIDALQKMPGAIVLAEHGTGYTFVVDRGAFLANPPQTGPYIRDALKARLGVDFPILELFVRNETRGSFTVSFGALSWKQVMDKLLEDPRGPEYWLETTPAGRFLRQDRIEEFYQQTMRLANVVLTTAKDRGRNRAVIADEALMAAIPAIPIERRQRPRVAPPSALQVADMERANSNVQRMNYGDLRSRYDHKPARFLYHFTVSNWLGGRAVALRALHALNANIGYDKVDLVIAAFSDMIPLAFPEASRLNIGRSPPDSFVVATDEAFTGLPETFMQQFAERLEQKFKEANGSDQLSAEDRQILAQIQPHFIIYRTSWEELRKARQYNSDEALEPLSPVQMLDVMASAEWAYDQMPPAIENSSTEPWPEYTDLDMKSLNVRALEPALDVDVRAGYEIVSLNASKIGQLSALFKTAQQRRKDTARKQFLRYYGAISIDDFLWKDLPPERPTVSLWGRITWLRTVLATAVPGTMLVFSYLMPITPGRAIPQKKNVYWAA